MKLVHMLPGRIRLEIPELYQNPGLARLLEEQLALADGIINIRANYKTSRLLITFSPDINTSLDINKIKFFIKNILTIWNQSRPSYPTVRKRTGKHTKELQAYELERLPIGRQAFFTAVSGALLLSTSLTQHTARQKTGSSLRGLVNFDTTLTILTGFPIFRTALDHLLKKGRLSSELLAGTASIASLAAQESRLGLFVVWLVYLSTLLRTLAGEYTRDRIRIMLEGKKPLARVQTPDGTVIVPGNQVAPGAVVIVRQGERIPVDGQVNQGSGTVNQCPIIGSAKLVHAAAGSPVYAGSLLMSGKLAIKTKRVGANTYIGRVMQILDQPDRIHPAHDVQVTRLMNKISLLSLAVAAVVYLATGNARHAITILVVGTPGAAGLASQIPLETGVGKAFRYNILVKSGSHLATAGQINTVLFNKSTLLTPHKNYDLEAIELLHEQNIAHIGLLPTEPGEQARFKLNHPWPICRPEDKVKVIKQLQKQGAVVAVVGDQASDAAALSAADVGIAFAKGSYLGLEAADIVIASNDPRQVAQLNRLARQSLQVARQNTVISVTVNLLGVSLGACNLLGHLTMALLQNFCTLAVLINSSRILLPTPSNTYERRLMAETAATTETRCSKKIQPPLKLDTRGIPVRKKQSPHGYKQCCIDAVIDSAWHEPPLPDILTALKANPARGLSTREAAARIKITGFNILPDHPRPSIIDIFRGQLQNYMSKVLLGIAGVSLLLGKQSNALMSSGVLLANTTMAVFQERRTAHSMQMLGGLVAPSSQVLRDGVEKTIPAKLLVPGDIITVKAGDKVPADARILESWQLTVEEASLTGESVPVLKQSSANNRANMLYLGTAVLSGRAKAVVVKTGAQTEMGRIASIISLSNQHRTPLHDRLDEIGVTLVRGGTAVSALALLAGLWHGESTGNMIINATNLAVSVIPDGLAPIITVAMGIGALRMGRRRALIRQLPAVDTLGCVSVICCDKTGTLTRNKMVVREIYCDSKHVTVDPQEGFSNTINCTDRESAVALFRAACLCNNATLRQDEHSGKWITSGDSTESALLAAAKSTGISLEELTGGFTRTVEIPFSSETRRMTVICQDQENIKWSFVKGAPDVVLDSCSSIFVQGQIEFLTDNHRRAIMQEIRTMSGRALRVLALAYKQLADDGNPEQELVFAGLVGILDPPRQEAVTALDRCRRAGVRTVMITGDHRDTALAIAREVGIAGKHDLALTGQEIDTMNELELARAVQKINVFARTSPRQKLRLIQAIKQQGQVVAMTGDGINDALAIKEAQLGIAMGKTGTAITREVAAVTLTDDNIATVPEAIKEGRIVYANIQKCIRYLIATNLGDGLVILTTALLGKPMPINPLQLLWINLSSDPLISWFLANDSTAPDKIKNSPRKPTDSIFSGGVGRKIATRSMAIGLSTLAVYNHALSHGGNVAVARTQTMAALGLSRFWYLMDCRRENCVKQNKPAPNKGIAAGGGLILATLLGGIYVPLISQALKTVPLGPAQWLNVLVYSGLGLVADIILNYLLEPGGIEIRPTGNTFQAIKRNRHQPRLD